MNCNGCPQKGLCCCMTIKKSNVLWILPSIECKHLNKKKECDIYETRHKDNPACSSIENLSISGGVPDRCNYRKAYTFPFITKVASPRKEKILLKRLYKHA